MNILFVDDQPNVLSSILTGNDWRGAGFSSVFSASSADAARKILQAHPVDILVTDIEMPGEDGLSLIAWLREQQMKTSCIVLTSHADFFYAQQAISLQITDYVVQPARPEDILRSVLKAKEKLEEEQQVREKNTPDNFTRAAWHTVIHDFFEHWPTYEEFISTPGLFTAKTASLMEYDVNCREDSTMIVLCSHVTKWRDLPLAPYALLDLIQDTLVRRLADEEIHPSTYLYAQNTYMTILTPQRPVADQNLETLLLSVRDEIFEKAKCELRMIASDAELIELRDVILALAEKDQAYSKEHKDQYLAPVLLELQLENTELPGGSNTDYLAQVEAFVRDHIGEPITRTQIAEALYVSPGYIGTVIKAGTGYSCKEYITHEKMSFARHLLQNTKLPIGEIAARCGYDNFAYFSKVYKDTYEITPSAERKN